jgi:hypothetical protein
MEVSTFPWRFQHFNGSFNISIEVSTFQWKFQYFHEGFNISMEVSTFQWNFQHFIGISFQYKLPDDGRRPKHVGAIFV